MSHRASITITALLLAAAPAAAEPLDRSVSVNFGLMQPIVLSGGNVEATLRFDRWVVDYSHGWALQILTTGTLAEQHLRQTVPYTTGFGGGPQFALTPALRFDVRAEFKLHKFVFDVETDDRRRTIASYRTATVGAGAYLSWQPFRRRRGALAGIVTTASVRYWPRVWSSLPGDQVTYANEATGRMEVHRAADIGLANTPVIVNLTIGYLFPL